MKASQILASQFCEICLDASSTIYCEEDDLFSCDSCDAEYHTISADRERHLRISFLYERLSAFRGPCNPALYQVSTCSRRLCHLGEIISQMLYEHSSKHQEIHPMSLSASELVNHCSPNLLCIPESETNSMITSASHSSSCCSTEWFEVNADFVVSGSPLSENIDFEDIDSFLLPLSSWEENQKANGATSVESFLSKDEPRVQGLVNVDCCSSVTQETTLKSSTSYKTPSKPPNAEQSKHRDGVSGKEHRLNALHRLREKRLLKRQNIHSGPKVRYVCRKQLAERRNRFKGRFVKNS